MAQTPKQLAAGAQPSTPAARVDKDHLLSVRKQIALVKAYKAHQEQAARHLLCATQLCRRTVCALPCRSARAAALFVHPSESGSQMTATALWARRKIMVIHAVKLHVE